MSVFVDHLPERTGAIRFFSGGYGIISCDDGGEPVVFSEWRVKQAGIESDFVPGRRVKFRAISERGRRPAALRIDFL